MNAIAEKHYTEIVVHYVLIQSLVQAQYSNLWPSLVKTDNAALAQAAATLGPIAEVKNAT